MPPACTSPESPPPQPQLEGVPRRPQFCVEYRPPPSAPTGSIAISPDGRRLAFSALNEGKPQLWVRPLDSLTPQPLAGTDNASESSPFWSPDGRSVGFFVDGKL